MREPPLIARAEEHGNRTAIVDPSGTWTYDDLLQASARVAAALLSRHDDLEAERVAFLITPGFPWVAVQWGIWRAGGIAVPLPIGSPAPELENLIDDGECEFLVFDAAGKDLLAPIAATRDLKALEWNDLHSQLPRALPAIGSDGSAMIVYTSGTTSRPKGVVTTHAALTAQITALISAWEWTPGDRIALCLPLHHVHGIVNVVCCALWAGAVCEMLPRFDAGAVWDLVAAGRLTLLMAVPTIYMKLIAAWEASDPGRRAVLRESASRLRLMVSGSAALPVSTLRRWQEITGHVLLERYGMTETCMILSNPYRGERIPGTVGTPLPGVEVRLVSDRGVSVPPGTEGQVEVRGPNVFREYWRRPKETMDAFREGWFRTGDTAIVENGVYRILGRTSTDIFKTGGHKVSALEIEEVLREHEAIAECAVASLPDEHWGERIVAAVVLNSGHSLDPESLRSWAKQRMAVHKVPSSLVLVQALPRNPMGKVIRSAVRDLFAQSA